MSDKPKIFATCPAGCLWETVHKDEFLESAAVVKLSPDYAGRVKLEKGKKYFLRGVNAESSSWDIEIKFMWTGADGVARILTVPTDLYPAFDKYAGGFAFELLDVKADPADNYPQFVCQFNGDTSTRQYLSSTVADTYQADGDYTCYAICESVELYNDGTLKSEKGDSVFIRYSANADGSNFTSTWNEGQKYIGVATGQTAPTDKSGYVWSKFAVDETGLAVRNEMLQDDTYFPNNRSIDDLKSSADVGFYIGNGYSLIVAQGSQYGDYNTIHQIKIVNTYKEDGTPTIYIRQYFNGGQYDGTWTDWEKVGGDKYELTIAELNKVIPEGFGFSNQKRSGTCNIYSVSNPSMYYAYASSDDDITMLDVNGVVGATVEVFVEMHFPSYSTSTYSFTGTLTSNKKVTGTMYASYDGITKSFTFSTSSYVPTREVTFTLAGDLSGFAPESPESISIYFTHTEIGKINKKYVDYSDVPAMGEMVKDPYSGYDIGERTIDELNSWSDVGFYPGNGYSLIVTAGDAYGDFSCVHQIKINNCWSQDSGPTISTRQYCRGTPYRGWSAWTTIGGTTLYEHVYVFIGLNSEQTYARFTMCWTDKYNDYGSDVGTVLSKLYQRYKGQIFMASGYAEETSSAITHVKVSDSTTSIVPYSIENGSGGGFTQGNIPFGADSLTLVNHSNRTLN